MQTSRGRFYLQWKVENCPYHTSITKATAISDEIYQLRAENATLCEKIEKAVELPFFQKDGDVIVLIYEDKHGKVCVEKYIEDEFYEDMSGLEAAEARLAEFKVEK